MKEVKEKLTALVEFLQKYVTIDADCDGRLIAGIVISKLSELITEWNEPTLYAAGYYSKDENSYGMYDGPTTDLGILLHFTPSDAKGREPRIVEITPSKSYIPIFFWQNGEWREFLNK